MLNIAPAKPSATVPMHKTADEMGIKPLTKLAAAIMGASRTITQGPNL